MKKLREIFDEPSKEFDMSNETLDTHIEIGRGNFVITLIFAGSICIP